MSDHLATQEGAGDAPQPVADPRREPPAQPDRPSEPNSDPSEQPSEPGQEEQKPEDRGPLEKRLARLRTRLSEAERQRATLEQQLAQVRLSDPTADPERARQDNERVEQLYQQRMAQEHQNRFHDQGRAAYSDWGERCQSLIEMGAGPKFAEMLIETPDGHRVAGALADDPEALEAILQMRSERAQAIALGKFAASLERAPAAPPSNISRAPPPIRPVNGGTRTGFNEYTADPNQLVDHYINLERKRRGL
jgi:hypothetical protein